MKRFAIAVAVTVVTAGCATRGDLRRAREHLGAEMLAIDGVVRREAESTDALELRFDAALRGLGATDRSVRSELVRLETALSDELRASAAECSKRIASVQSDCEARTQAVSMQVQSLQAELMKRLTALERLVNWSGSLRARVDGPTWTTVYANGTGRSQRVRVRTTDAVQGLRLRVIATSKLPIEASEVPSEAAVASWDLSSIGGERWIRLMCGFEIQAKPGSGAAQLRLLVARDERPLSCDQ